MKHVLAAALAGTLFVQFATPLTAQGVVAADGRTAAGVPPAPYALVADQVLASTLILDATVRSTTRIKGAEAVGVAAGHTRLFVQADVNALVTGTSSVPPQIGYLIDIALDARGRVPNLKKQRVLLFARAVAGRPALIQLVDPAAQRRWDPALDALVRRIAAEVIAPDAPPAITGVRSAFHVAGSLPGEGETQIFLATEQNRPVSLSVLRRPGETPRWAVATSEIVDDAAAPPARDTLLWYRLACALPAELPEPAAASMEPGDADIAREDYRFVIERLGPCRKSG